MRDRVLLLNGPPRSGKDTANEHLFQEYKYRDDLELIHDKFSFPLKYGVLAFLGLFSLDSELAKELEADKDKPHYLLRGKSYRQAQIALSENHIKPFYGRDQFGLWAVHRIKEAQNFRDKFKFPGNCPILFIFSDSGFAHEAEPIIKYMGAENVALIRIHRDGYDFSNDSRGYIDLSDFGVTTFDVNNTTLEEYKKRLTEVTNKWLAM